jgi:hypothetical protein
MLLRLSKGILRGSDSSGPFREPLIPVSDVGKPSDQATTPITISSTVILSSPLPLLPNSLTFQCLG